MQSIHVFALAATGEGISGSDRIFIEFARRWSKEIPVKIYLWGEGYEMCLRHKLQITNVKFQISNMEPWKNYGFFINYIVRIVEGIRLGLTAKLENSKDTIIYSASEFWMDSFPCLILKLRYSKIKWVSCWFQTAPNLLKGFTEGESSGRYKLSALVYYLMQLPVKPLISSFADFVLVNNDQEKEQFSKHAASSKAIVVLGAVDLEKIRISKFEFRNLPKVYDAVFQGRFHPQKGVEELVDIWKMVVDEIPTAKLVMIGDGPLMERVKGKVKREKLEDNIKLTGYLFDGEEKYKIFAQSKIVLHPAFYDSGGMAAAEAMAFGIPAVGFDLAAFKSYYPKGMIKVSKGDLVEFAAKVLGLIRDSNGRDRVGKEGLEMIKKSWSWDIRAGEVFDKITG